MKIAFFEDDEDLRPILSMMLRALGCQVQEFERPAFDITIDADVIVTDNQMPGGMTGIDYTKHLRLKGFTGPIILYTADETLEEEFISNGGSKFFIKTDPASFVMFFQNELSTLFVDSPSPFC